MTPTINRASTPKVKPVNQAITSCEVIGALPASIARTAALRFNERMRGVFPNLGNHFRHVAGFKYGFMSRLVLTHQAECPWVGLHDNK